MNKQQQQPKKSGPKKAASNRSKQALNKPGPERYAQGLKKAPVAQQRTRQIKEPRFERSSGNGDITVEHEEFIQDVNGSVAFTNSGIQVNPGLILTFPWLAQMAPLYESYLFEKLEFRFESTSATTATGSIMLAVDYDASDPVAVSKAQLATYRRYVRSAPWEECQCSSILEDLRKQKSFFVRNGSLSANQDIKLYDVGLLNVATQGQVDTSPIGELYVRYRVRFMTPQLLDPGIGSALSSRFTVFSAGGGWTKNGTAPIVATGTGAALTLTSTAPYQGLVGVTLAGTGITDIVNTGTATVGSSTDVENGTGTAAAAVYQVNFSAVGQTLILTSTVTTITTGVVRVGQYAAVNS